MFQQSSLNLCKQIATPKSFRRDSIFASTFDSSRIQRKFKVSDQQEHILVKKIILLLLQTYAMAQQFLVGHQLFRLGQSCSTLWCIFDINSVY
jgi:hypothetical protein